MGEEGRLALIAGSCVGKSELVRALEADPRSRQKVLIELDSFLPAWFIPELPQHLDDESRADYWYWTKMSATRTALRATPSLIAGVFAESKLRALLEERGYSLKVLSITEEAHRERLLKRARERSDRVPADISRTIKAQQRLQRLGYELIDACRSPREIANHLLARGLIAYFLYASGLLDGIEDLAM